MTKSIRSKLAPLLGVTLLLTSLALAASTGTAAADNVSAQASGLASASGICDATGTPAGVSYPDADADSRCGQQPILSLNPLATVGAVGQDVLVDTNGHSQACGGLVAQGGALQISPDTGCTPSGGNGDGLVVGVPGVLDLRVSAVYAECSASATGLSGHSSIAEDLQLSILGGLAPAPNLGDILNAAPNSSPINLAGLITLTLNQQVVTANSIEVTALRLQVLGLDITIGYAKCSVDAVNNDFTSGSFDSSGDVTAPFTGLQPGTRNALAVTFHPGGDRNNLRGTIRLGPGLAIDTDRANNPAVRTSPFGPGGAFGTTGTGDSLPPNCAFINVVGDPHIDCTFGNVVGGNNPVVTVPVIIADNAPAILEASAQMKGVTTNPAGNPADLEFLYGRGPASNNDKGALFGQGALPANGTIPAGREGLIQAPLQVEEIRTEGNAGGTVNITDIRLPNSIPGQLYLDLPDYITAAKYGPTICDILTEPVSVPEHLRPETYPENPDAGFTRWTCGQAQKGVNVSRALELTIAADAPSTPANAEPPVGRIVIVRRGGVTGNNNAVVPNPSIADSPRIAENSYYSNLFLRVVNGGTPINNHPSVLVDLTVNPASRPAPGGDFTYTATITNNSNTAETITTLEKQVRNNNGPFSAYAAFAGGPTCQVGTSLAAGASCQFTFVDPLQGVTGDTETHQLRAVVTENVGNETAADDDPATATIGNQHTITVNKTALNDELPAPGGDFTYEVTITNDTAQNDGNITITSITDEIAGQADINLNAGDADCKAGTVLAEGASCTFQFVHTFTGVAGAEQTDTVRVRGTAADNNPAVGADEETVFIIDNTPGLVVTKLATPDNLPEPGGDFTYKVTVQNTLNQDLTLTKLTDTIDVVGNNDKVTDLDGKGTCKVGGVIKPGAANAYSCTFTTNFTGNAKDTQTDIATATAKSAGGATYQDTDAETVTLTDVLPRIRVDETVEPPARKTPGGDFTWKVTITNESKAKSDPVQITSLRNELLLDIEKDPDCGKLIGKILDVGQSISCSFTTKVEGPDGKVGSDIVVATAKDDEGNSVSDLGTAAVSLTADIQAPPPVVERTSMPKTGANTRTTAAAAMLFAGLGLVLTGGGMQNAPELALGDQRRRRRR